MRSGVAAMCGVFGACGESLNPGLEGLGGAASPRVWWVCSDPQGFGDRGLVLQ